MKIINLTMHPASEDQKKEGVIEPSDKSEVKKQLLFESIPSIDEIQQRANKLSEIAVQHSVDAAMIGGAPFLMSALERALKEKGIRPLYAFSKRESVEKVVEGKTVKKTVFRHLGFVKI